MAVLDKCQLNERASLEWGGRQQPDL